MWRCSSLWWFRPNSMWSSSRLRLACTWWCSWMWRFSSLWWFKYTNSMWCWRRLRMARWSLWCCCTLWGLKWNSLWTSNRLWMACTWRWNTWMWRCSSLWGFKRNRMWSCRRLFMACTWWCSWMWRCSWRCWLFSNRSLWWTGLCSWIWRNRSLQSITRCYSRFFRSWSK